MLAKKNDMIGKAYAILEELSEDEKTRLLSESREKALRDQISRMEGAREEGKLEGIIEGEQKGEKKKTFEIVKNSLKSGLSYEMISSITSLSIDEVKKIESELD